MACMLGVAIFVLAQASGWASARPPECGALERGQERGQENGRQGNVWERAKSPELRHYCDALASAAAKLAGAKPQTTAVVALADEADKLLPGKAAPHAMKGRALALSGDFAGAYQELTQAKAKDDAVLDDPRTLLAWARVLSRTGRKAEAITAFRALLPRASTLAPHERASAEIESGMLTMAQGPESLDEAIAVLRQAARDAQDVAQVVATAALALAIDRGGDDAEARALLAEHLPSDALAALATKAAKDLVGPSGEGELDAMQAIALEGKDEKASRAAWQRYSGQAKSPWLEHARARASGVKKAAAKPAGKVPR